MPVRQFFTGQLDNTGEVLELRDSGGTLADIVNPDGGIWPAGTEYIYAAMVRRVPHNAGVDANWETSTHTVRRAEGGKGDSSGVIPIVSPLPRDQGNACYLTAPMTLFRFPIQLPWTCRRDL